MIDLDQPVANYSANDEGLANPDDIFLGFWIGVIVTLWLGAFVALVIIYFLDR